MQVVKPEVRAAILESAKEEFVRKGFSDASVRTITANARTSAGNFYNYYSSKEDLFLELVLPVTDECIDMVRKNFDIASDKLQTVAYYIADYIARNRDIFRILTGGPAEHYSAFINRFVACISDILKEQIFKYAPEAAAKIRNPSFFDVVATAYVGGLRPIIENFSDIDTMAEYISELMNFLFGDFTQRLMV